MTTMTAPTPDAHHQPDPQQGPVVYGGVDTHSDTHTAAVVDPLGAVLGTATFPATQRGLADLREWMLTHGRLAAIGVEGSGCYGMGLGSALRAQDLHVIEVNRPNRATRRARGKSDDIDAIEAARGVAAGRHQTPVKDHSGATESLRLLHNARAAFVSARADTMRQLKSTLVTAPPALRERLQHLSDSELITTCAALRPGTQVLPVDPHLAAKTSLRCYAQHYLFLSEQIEPLDTQISALVAHINPALTTPMGIGPITAAQLLITAGANPERLHSEAAFSMLCGTSPIPASSGRTHRHRLNRGGDRNANKAIHHIVITRTRHCPRTRAYIQRRTEQGLSTREIRRCLKRYVAREIYRILTTTPS